MLQVTQRMVWLFGICPGCLLVLVLWTDSGQRASQLKRDQFPFSLQAEHRIPFPCRIKDQKGKGDVWGGSWWCECRGRHGSLGAVPFLTCWLEHLSAASLHLATLFTLRVAWSNWFPLRVIGCLIPRCLHCLQKGKLRQTGLSRPRMCSRNELSYKLSLLELELLIFVG